jgi:hypothetical protein
MAPSLCTSATGAATGRTAFRSERDYTVLLYRPRFEVPDRSWSFPTINNGRRGGRAFGNLMSRPVRTDAGPLDADLAYVFCRNWISGMSDAANALAVENYRIQRQL